MNNIATEITIDFLLSVHVGRLIVESAYSAADLKKRIACLGQSKAAEKMDKLQRRMADKFFKCVLAGKIDYGAVYVEILIRRERYSPDAKQGDIFSADYRKG